MPRRVLSILADDEGYDEDPLLMVCRDYNSEHRYFSCEDCDELGCSVCENGYHKQEVELFPASEVSLKEPSLEDAYLEKFGPSEHKLMEAVVSAIYEKSISTKCGYKYSMIGEGITFAMQGFSDNPDRIECWFWNEFTSRDGWRGREQLNRWDYSPNSTLDFSPLISMLRMSRHGVHIPHSKGLTVPHPRLAVMAELERYLLDGICGIVWEYVPVYETKASLKRKRE